MPAVTSDPYRAFRPRRARVVAWIAAIGTVVCFGILALTVPYGGHFGWNAADSIGTFAFGLLIAAFLLRYTALRAVPSKQGLVVRNLIYTRRLDWAQIVGVQFGGGQPWLMLDLANTEQLAVMAVMRSDGQFAVAEAQRMAALVERHSMAAE